jgi:steroid delta-isomerase-like uncharacterized protein
VTDYVLRSDFLVWLIARLAPGVLLDAAGVPRSVQPDLSPQLRNELVDGFSPASARHVGLGNDIRNAVRGWPDLPIEQLEMPLLLVVATDDPYQSGPIVRYSSRRVPLGADGLSGARRPHPRRPQTTDPGGTARLPRRYSEQVEERLDVSKELMAYGDAGCSPKARGWKDARPGKKGVQEDGMMGAADRRFLDSYLAAWNAHDSAAVARHMADDAIYEDVALGRVLHGPSEIASFVEEATRSSSDFRFESVSLLTVGADYANEWVMLGTNNRERPGVPATGRSFRVRGASIGRLDANGRIVSPNVQMRPLRNVLKAATR